MDARGLELLRAFRAGDAAKGIAYLWHASRVGDLKGTKIAWSVEAMPGGPSSGEPKRGTITPWRSWDGIECPDCDSLRVLGTVRQQRWRDGTAYQSGCCGAVLPAFDLAWESPPFVCVEGHTGPLELGDLLDWLGADLIGIETPGEIEQERIEFRAARAAERATEDAAAEERRRLNDERARVRSVRGKLTRARAARKRAAGKRLAATTALRRFEAAQEGRTSFPSTAIRRVELTDTLEIAEERLAEIVDRIAALEAEADGLEAAQ